MPEYIEREATIELLRRLGNRDYRREKGTIQEAIKMVSFPEYTPSADVAPVRHGRWELYGNDDDLAASFFCSLCGWNMDEDEYLDRWSHLNYCPNCGAKMNEEASE